jgi:hypothetical protein
MIVVKRDETKSNMACTHSSASKRQKKAVREGAYNMPTLTYVMEIEKRIDNM